MIATGFKCVSVCISWLQFAYWFLFFSLLILLGMLSLCSRSAGRARKPVIKWTEVNILYFFLFFNIVSDMKELTVFVFESTFVRIKV